MLSVKLTREEIAARGEEIYEAEIRSKVEAQYKGQYLVLDIETGTTSFIPMIWSRLSKLSQNAPMLFHTECESVIRRLTEY